MLIILEGPDGGGKTTLANAFREARKGSLARKDPPTFWEYRSQLGGRTMDHGLMRSNTYSVMNDLRNGRLTDGVLLCERFHAISDDVYRLIFGGKRFLTLIETEGVYADLGRRADVRLVYCRPPVDVVVSQGLKKAGDDTDEWLETVGHGIRTLYDAYDRHMNRMAWFWGVPVLRYDYTEQTTAKEIEGLICAA
jgi:hypothetical protein